MCEKGKMYIDEEEFKTIEVGDSIVMESPYRRSNNSPDERYIEPESSVPYRAAKSETVTWRGQHSNVKRPSLKFYQVENKDGKIIDINPGSEIRFYRCEAGDPTHLEGGRRHRMRRKTKRTKKHLRRSRRRLRSLN